jgi:hypothetical protein
MFVNIQNGVLIYRRRDFIRLLIFNKLGGRCSEIVFRRRINSCGKRRLCDMCAAAAESGA